MPRWNASETDKAIHPIIYLLFILSLSVTAYSVYIFTKFTSAGAIFLGLFSVSFLIFMMGRLYGEFNKHKDFVEVSKEGIQHRTTPPLTLGWLPKTEFFPFDVIESVDIAEQVSPFSDPSKQQLSILLRLKGVRTTVRIIGFNLSKEQIIKVGLAIKGTVGISNALKRLLGNDVNVSDTVSSLVKKGKQMWDTFQNMQNKEE